MAKHGPIIIVEDDVDDQEILTEIFTELGVNNELLFFGNAPDALRYLLESIEQPFIIICDNNLPRVNGLEFKRQIDSNPYLRKKSVPFVFLSTSAAGHAVDVAYTQLTVQGIGKEVCVSN